MGTNEQIKAEILEELGFFPPFFEPAQETPEVLANLWQQTLLAYVNNPLPALFKEKLFAYLSRYCSVPYSIICHSCALRQLGMTAGEVLELLQKPASEIASDIEAQITILESQPQPLTVWPEPNSILERSLYRAAILVFLRPYHAEHYRNVLQRLLGNVYYTHLISFLGYVKMCHQWVECHPNIAYQADRRAQLYLASLLSEAPSLAEVFEKYGENVRQENQKWENELTKRITELQRVEKALQETEKKCKLLVNSVKDVIFQTDITGNWTFLNQAWCEITGFSIQESIGTHFTNYIHPDDRQRNLEEFQALIESRKELSCHEVRYLTKEGDCRWLEIRAQSIASDGTVIGTSGTLRDISDRKASEIALQQSNDILRAVIEGTTDAVFVKDTQGRYILANSAVARIQGRPVEEIIGRDDSELLSRETALKLMETDRRIMSSGQSEVLEEIATVNNNTRTYLSTKDVYRDSQGNVIGVIGISRDISDRKQLELEREQLIEQLRQEREDLAALSTVTANAISTLNLDELLDVLLRRIVQVLRANTAVILLKEADRLRVRATIGIDEELHCGFAVPIGQGFAGTIAADCQPLYVEDAQTDPRVTSQIIKQHGIRTILGVPLKRNGTLVGVLHVDWFSNHPYSDREVHLLEITAERCTMAILNAQLFEQTKQLKEQLQLQIDKMPIGCILHDRDCRLIDWNPAAERIFRFTKQEVLGRDPCDLIVSPSVRTQVDEILGRLTAGDITANSINENITKDGHTIICEWHNTPLKSPDGSVIGILSMVQDITERKLAEEALRQSEERFRQMAENIHEVFWMADQKLTQILYINPAYEEIWGRSRKSLYEQPSSFIQTIHPDDRQRALAVFLRQRQQGFNLEYRIVRPDGSVRWISDRAFPVRNGEGQPYRLVGVSRDITERKLAEEALRESEERFRTMADSATVLLWMSDTEGLCTFFNQTWLAFTGHTLEEEFGNGWLQGVHPDDLQRHIDIYTTAFRNCQIYQTEYRLRSADGEYRWILEKAAPRFTPSGNFLGYIGSCVDISDRFLAEEALRTSEKRYRTLFQSNPHPMWVFDRETLVFLDVNEAAIQRYGYSRDEFLAMTIRDIRPPEDIPALLNNLSNNNSWGYDAAGVWRHRKKDGTIIYVEITSHTIVFLGRIAEVVLANDVTERKLAEDALRESERRYHTLAQMSPVGIFHANAQGKCIYFNERWCEISGLTIEESLGEGWAKALHPDDRERFLWEWYRAATEKLPFHSEYRALRPDGTITWVFAQAVAEVGQTGEVLGYVGTLTDITDRKLAEEQLRRYAFYDPLTGLPNRTLFLEQLEQTIELAKCGQVSLFAVLLLDLDRFQMVKFSLGHQFADRLLVATADRLQRCFASQIVDENTTTNTCNPTPQFIVAQVGLDEFAIVLANLREVDDATRIAEQICQELTLPFNLDGQEVFINASIGIALSSINYNQPEDYLRAADTAMHQSKKLRKAGYAVFEPKWQTNAVERLHLEADLRRAIERQELRVYYQPIVSLANNQITGFEALVRWQHPTRGLVSPGDFIPIAEETGLIIAIDRWVLREACRQIVIWQQTFPSNEPLTIGANLSAIQLVQSDLIVEIEQILQSTGINRKSLKLEITESSLQENTTAEKAMLEQLKGLGVELAIDDFGTGYSSLARLHQMPIDKLKIDRSFINQMGVDKESLEFVRTIVRLAHILDLDVIAEGVETAEQLVQLKALQCEYGQGYFFSRPVDSKAAEALLTASNNE